MRIQTMILPAPADQYDFAIVLDECAEEDVVALSEGFGCDIKRHTGAKAVLAFAATVEVV